MQPTSWEQRRRPYLRWSPVLLTDLSPLLRIIIEQALQKPPLLGANEGVAIKT